jgi:hypothetical protein
MSLTQSTLPPPRADEQQRHSGGAPRSLGTFDLNKYQQVLLESLFSLTKLLNMLMLRNFEFIWGKTLNHSVQSQGFLHYLKFYSY